MTNRAESLYAAAPDAAPLNDAQVLAAQLRLSVEQLDELMDLEMEMNTWITP